MTTIDTIFSHYTFSFLFVSPAQIQYPGDRSARYQRRNSVTHKTSGNIIFLRTTPSHYTDDNTLSRSSSDSCESIQPKRTKINVSPTTKLYETRSKFALVARDEPTHMQPICKIESASKDINGQSVMLVNMDSSRDKNINQNQSKMEFSEELQPIGVQDPQEPHVQEIPESRTEFTRKRRKKMKKTNKLKDESNYPEEDLSPTKIYHELANEFYLYHLFYDYHSSLVEKYKDDKRVPTAKRERLNSDPHRIDKAASSTDLYEDAAKLADFIPFLYSIDILKPKEKKLLEYSLKHRYLSENIAQLSNLVERPTENRIAKAIDDLIEGPEKKTFEDLFESVYKKPPFDIVKTPVLDSTNLVAQISDLVTNNADDWDFHEKKLLDADVKIIAGKLTTNKSCKSLDLRHNKITDTGAHYLAQMLSVNHTLKALLLSYNNICDIGLRHLCKAMNASINSLELLYLNKNGITEDGVKALTEVLDRNKSLTDLSLNYNQIGDDGVRALSNVLISKNTTLKHLYLHGNGITDNGVDVIIEMIESPNALEQIKLQDNQISTKCRDQLHTAKKYNVDLHLFL